MVNISQDTEANVPNGTGKCQTPACLACGGTGGVMVVDGNEMVVEECILCSNEENTSE